MNSKNNEYDRADFQGLYQGKSLISSVEITAVPWDIGNAQPVVCEILRSDLPGKLLDVGCGLGHNARAAADMGYIVTAIDSAPTAIKSCQKRQSKEQIRFRVANACETELNEKFDMILDSATYHAIPFSDRIAYMKEMHRLANDKTEYHVITFAPSHHGMPKPLAIELSQIADTAEKSGWQIEAVSRVEYKGNAEAIIDFCEKKNLTILLDEAGHTRLPSWHIILKTII
ncbi:class I SAM-dependent methyltransferase [Facilibium subflavum]|uniref:class I SAM-dependent methyltransferase n=1 Tax=Facilibium subflavum TaxID=2219058 RepID=UPI000E65B5A0|nr:class I SAM-dependent methyltransferase [Facilibium subflavum]